MIELERALQSKLDGKTKPHGSLGLLEKIALKVGMIQGSLRPALSSPHLLVFAGDHGIAEEGLSAYPQEVTYQMVYNFLDGGAAINVLARQNSLALMVIDAGVNHHFAKTTSLIDKKVGMGTRSFLRESAMTDTEMQCALEYGAQVVEDTVKNGCNVVGFGEMGIGNTASASIIMSKICGIPIKDCVGRGTGIDDKQLDRKIELLTEASYFHKDILLPEQVLQTFGGYEIVQMCGAMLKAASSDLVILVDGFIATASFLVAHAIKPEILNNAIFCHCSSELGHQKALDGLHVKPILNMGMRLGEGTGCALAYPIIQSAVNILNEMASFEEVGVSERL